eukprot:Skav211799  [mRNA]  locus=scaffold305:348845:350849:+ [translate_table: standard]
MIAKLTWILCFVVALCANAVDVTLRIATTSASSKLEVYWKDTGCTLQTERQDVTCTPKDDGSDLGQVPATFASAVINCKNMNTSAYDSLQFRFTEWCAKFTYTQHMENGGDKVRVVHFNHLQIFPGSIVNITCVMFTRPMDKAMLAGSEVRQNFPIWGKKGVAEMPGGWDMPFVLVRAANLAETDADKCLEVLNPEFAWGVGLGKSPNRMSDFTVTKTARDVALKNLDPKITQAGCSTASGDFAHLVKLKTLEPPAVQDQVEKHEEKLEISVDATGLPKGTKELDITLEYTFPPHDPERLINQAKLKLPVSDPIIDEKPTEEPAKKPTEEPAVKPTEEPKEEKKPDGDEGLLAFLLTCAAGARQLSREGSLYAYSRAELRLFGRDAPPSVLFTVGFGSVKRQKDYVVEPWS